MSASIAGNGKVIAGVNGSTTKSVKRLAKKLAKQVKKIIAKNGNPVVEQREKKLGGSTGKGFMPGQSGNPHGRAKGRIELGALIRKFLGEIHPGQVEDIINGLVSKAEARTRLQVLVEDLAANDPRTLLAYGFGKPVETVELVRSGEADNEKPAELAAPRLREVVTWLDSNAPRGNGNVVKRN